MKKKINYKVIFTIILIFLFVLLGICIKNIYSTLSKTEEVKTLSAIDAYGYILNENDSPYFQEIFKELEECLNKSDIDYDNYAELISKLFVVDFYSLEYSLSKSDVGGTQFITSDYQDSFVSKAKDTVYAYVESNVYGKRDQELPNVISVEVESIENSEYDGELYQDDEAYYVDLKLTYEEDLDYPEEVSLVLIHNDNKLEIVKVD